MYRCLPASAGGSLQNQFKEAEKFFWFFFTTDTSALISPHMEYGSVSARVCTSASQSIGCHGHNEVRIVRMCARESVCFGICVLSVCA